MFLGLGTAGLGLEAWDWDLTWSWLLLYLTYCICGNNRETVSVTVLFPCAITSPHPRGTVAAIHPHILTPTRNPARNRCNIPITTPVQYSSVYLVGLVTRAMAQ